MKKNESYDMHESWISFDDVLSKSYIPIEVECDSNFVAVSSDYHIGNKMFAEKKYKKFCKIAKDFDAVHFIPGDWIDGICSYSIKHGEVIEPDPVKQTILAKEKIPEDGTMKYVIGGNHENMKYLNTKENVCELLCEDRSDIIYCGDFYGRFSINGRIMDMFHIRNTRRNSVEKIMNNMRRPPEAATFGHSHHQFGYELNGTKILINGGFKVFGKGSGVGGWMVDFNEEDIDTTSIYSWECSPIPKKSFHYKIL